MQNVYKWFPGAMYFWKPTKKSQVNEQILNSPELFFRLNIKEKKITGREGESKK